MKYSRERGDTLCYLNHIENNNKILLKFKNSNFKEYDKKSLSKLYYYGYCKYCNLINKKCNRLISKI